MSTTSFRIFVGSLCSFIYRGRSGFDSKINEIVSMPSYDVNARKSLLQPF